MMMMMMMKPKCEIVLKIHVMINVMKIFMKCDNMTCDVMYGSTLINSRVKYLKLIQKLIQTKPKLIQYLIKTITHKK